jgi:hypothetical protein
MGRTIPSFRLALEMEKDDWKTFRNALDKSDRKKFDDMFDIPRLYTSACSYAVQPVRLYPILMSILLHNFEELTQCISEAERIEAKLTKTKELTKQKQEEKEQWPQPRPTVLSPPQQQRQFKLTEF